MITADTPLTIKELAHAVGRCRWFVWSARRYGGFKLTQRRATVAEWREWEAVNPTFTARHYRRQHLPTPANT